MPAVQPKTTDNESHVWWAGSDEWEPWIRAPAIRVLDELPSDDFKPLLLVETLGEHPEQFLFGVLGPRSSPTPGSPIGAMVFRPPERWDGTSALNLRDLSYVGEVVIGARRDDIPSLTPDQLERRRKGWWW
jgi:hypothetical protein